MTVMKRLLSSKARFVDLGTMLLVIASTLMLVSQFLTSRCFLEGSHKLRSSVLSVPFPDSPTSISFSWEAKHNRSVMGKRDNSLHIRWRPLRRVFKPYGSATHVFIQMSAYRGGLNTFAVIGLASKPLHVFREPRFECEWVPGGERTSASEPIRVDGWKILRDWGYGRVYIAMVVNCTFPQHVGVDGLGGQLVLYAYHSSGGRASRDTEDVQPPPERIVALTEATNGFDASRFTATTPSPFDYLYCGSPLFGDLSPQRVREWMAYHAKLLGKRSHFVIYDAGGVHPAVLRVFQPWMDAGYVTMHDVRDQEWFDGYYHNQFMVINDCLHRYRFDTKWIFYFDLDEYVFVPDAGKREFDSVMNSLHNYTQFTMEQKAMSHKLCLQNDSGKIGRQWGFEKLVFRDVRPRMWRDRKYAIQARNAFSAGVHQSEHVIGHTTHQTEGRIMYYHYHDAIASRPEPCNEFVNAKNFTFEGTSFAYDDTLRKMAPAIKRFEIKMIGNRLTGTPQ